MEVTITEDSKIIVIMIIRQAKLSKKRAKSSFQVKIADSGAGWRLLIEGMLAKFDGDQGILSFSSAPLRPRD
jgi:hypothetical protein